MMTSTNKYERDLVSHQSTQQRRSNRVGCYEIIKTIGKGNFATVKLASHIYTKEKVAIKIVDKTRMDPENLKKVKREIDILRKLDHPHIIKLYQVMHSEKALYLVTEYAPGGEVFDQLLSNGKMLEKDARRCFKQICTALYYCHQRDVVHRDLKVENVLLDSNGDVKLADFGFSNYQKEGHLMKTWCGSPPYAAPELFEGREYNGPKADVWSLGVVLFVLVCGGLPFEDTDLPTLRTRVLSGKYRIPFYMSHECEDLLRRMLKVDPDQRYTLKQVFRHPWMKIGGPDPGFETQIKECEDLEKDQKEENLNDHLLNEMERAGLNRERVVSSIRLKRFDNFSTCYYLMLTKWQRYQQNKTTTSNSIINNPHLLHNIKSNKPSLLSGPPITEAVINDQLMDVNMTRDQRLYDLANHANLIDVNYPLMSSSSRPETIPQIELRDENSQVIQINDDNVLLDTDSDSEEPQPQVLARYLSQGRRHTYGVTGVNQLTTSILDRVPNVQETQFKTLMEATNQAHHLVGPRFNVYSYGVPGYHANAHNTTNPIYNPTALPMSTQQDYNLRPRQLNHLAAYDTSAGRRASDGGANMELVLGEHQRRLHLAYARQLSNLPKATMKQQQQQSCYRDPASTAQYLTDKSSNTNQEKDLSEEDEPNIEEIRRYLQSDRKRHTIADFSEDINHQTPATTTTGFHHAVAANNNRPRYCRRQLPVLPTTTECENNPTSSPYQTSDRHKRRSLDNASTIQQFQQTFNDRSTNVKNLQLEYQQLSKQYPSGHHTTTLPFDVQHRSRFNNRIIQVPLITPPPFQPAVLFIIDFTATRDDVIRSTRHLLRDFFTISDRCI